jgi:hypothetical protein
VQAREQFVQLARAPTLSQVWELGALISQWATRFVAELEWAAHPVVLWGKDSKLTVVAGQDRDSGSENPRAIHRHDRECSFALRKVERARP